MMREASQNWPQPAAATGTFDNVTPGYTVDYGTDFNSQITLSLAALPGDWNGDGKVDAADYVAWRKSPDDHGGNPGYELWKTNFGMPPSGGSNSAEGGAVPEPATALLIAMAITALPAARARRRTIA